MAKAKHMSDETAHAIDEEVRAIVNRNYARARQILIDNMDILHAMKDALVKYETIEEEQIKQLMNREPVTPPSGWEDNKDTSPKAKPQEDATESAVNHSEDSEE
jgi:ATP-dependent zinc metalloprotease ftsH homolog